MRHFPVLTAVVMAVLLAPTVKAQGTAAKIDSLVSRYYEYGRFNGSVLVAENGAVILKKGYGYANLEWDVPCTPDTKYRIASITKQFTAMLIMRQVEQGKIVLDDPMIRYLPDYPKAQGEKVTIRQLLNHTSGIPSYTEIRNARDPREARVPWRLDSLIGIFSRLPLEFEPGTKFKYNNSGYVLLGAILERLTRLPYEQLLQREILGPLGMKSSGYDHATPILKKRAAGYERSGGLQNAEYLDMSIPYSAGSMYSTVEDLYLWDQGLYSGKLLSPKWEAEYYKPGLSSYAFGWVVRNMPVGLGPDSVWTISHAGGINGFNTWILRVPAKRQLIVLLNNTGGAPVQAISTAILGVLYGRPYAEPKRSIAFEMEKLIGQNGLEAAFAGFERMKADRQQFELREGELNDLGYQLLRSGEARGAIEIFKANVKEFPGSANVYDSLGEAYAADGQIDLAIENYARSVELNPKNEDGRKALQDLRAKRGK